MYRNTIRSIARTTVRPATGSRSIHLSTPLYASKPAHEPISTQGHTTDKSQQPLHRDSDVQSAAVRAADDARADAAGKSSGDNEPFDAARQGNADGNAKGVGAKGAFKDQIGGQDEPQKGPGVTKGKSRPAAGYNIRETLKNTVESFVGSEKRSFGTSTRALAESTTPRADPDGARKPVDNQVHGDQNAHLKHTAGGSQGKAGQGNASPDPSLPSKKSNKQSTSSQTRAFSTTARALADPNTPSVDTPRPAEKDAQTQTGLKQQPRGDQVEHGGAAGSPSQSSTGAPGAADKPDAATGAPDPEIPSSQRSGKTAQGMGVRKFSTSAFIRAASPPGGYAKAVPGEPASSGYDAPATALPSGLKSAYQERDPKAVQGADSNLTPSSKAPYSSTAVDPPNEALRKAVLEGTMPEKNPQPQSEYGEMGNKEAWKHRKIG